MAIYVVGYDLKAGQSYDQLLEALKRFPNWWHHLDSTWLIQSDHSAQWIRYYLWQFMYSNDELLVLKYIQGSLGGEAAWNGFSAEGGSWLKSML